MLVNAVIGGFWNIDLLKMYKLSETFMFIGSYFPLPDIRYWFVYNKSCLFKSTEFLGEVPKRPSPQQLVFSVMSY